MLPLFLPIAGLCAHHQIYAVGGAVRAHLWGARAAETDFCTPSLPTEICASCQRLGLPVHTRGLAWGSINIAGCDITTFRTETYTPGNRYPAVSFTQNLLEDAARRDFTCNAIYLAPDGALTDPYQGVQHWQARQVIWIGDPLSKLTEDPLRWWRWLRLCALTDNPFNLITPLYTKHPGQSPMPIDLNQLALGAAQPQSYLSAALRQREVAKFNSQPQLEKIRHQLQQLLAPKPELAQRLIP